MTGHIVDCYYEVPVQEGAVSRHVARNLAGVAEDITLGRGDTKYIGLNVRHPDIARLGLKRGGMLERLQILLPGKDLYR